MEKYMTNKEKKFVSALCVAAVWGLLFLAANVAFRSGIVGNAVDTVLSSYYLMTMVIEAILATIIMGVGLTSFVTVKQSNAYKKAQAIERNQTEEEKDEYIVE